MAKQRVIIRLEMESSSKMQIEDACDLLRPPGMHR
jgi:hypothetical protein